MTMTKISSVYKHHHDPGISITAPTLTQQQFKLESDINEILRRYRITGVLPQSTAHFTYGDFSQDITYQEALDFISYADGLFGDLPSHIRARFSNDPAQMIDFLDNPSNRAEAIQLGLIAPLQPQPQPQSPPGEPTPQKPA